MIDHDHPVDNTSFHLWMQNSYIATASVCFTAAVTLQYFLDHTGNPIDFSDKAAQLQWAVDAAVGMNSAGAFKESDAFIASLLISESALGVLGVVSLVSAAVHCVFANRLLDKLQTAGRPWNTP